MKEIIINCKVDGTVELEGKGFKGAECNKFMAFFENALGKILGRKNKPEIYEGDVDQCQRLSH